MARSVFSMIPARDSDSLKTEALGAKRNHALSTSLAICLRSAASVQSVPAALRSASVTASAIFNLELIASENYASRAVREAMASAQDP
jgi:hypothetical protein